MEKPAHNKDFTSNLLLLTTMAKWILELGLACILFYTVTFGAPSRRLARNAPCSHDREKLEDALDDAPPGPDALNVSDAQNSEIMCTLKRIGNWPNNPNVDFTQSLKAHAKDYEECLGLNGFELSNCTSVGSDSDDFVNLTDKQSLIAALRKHIESHQA